jgi:hypothetical protein
VGYTISTYTCAPISIDAIDSKRNTITTNQNVSVRLTGLGQGYAYASLGDCRAGTNATSTLFLSAGSTTLSFYYRTTAAEDLTVTATTDSGSTASTLVKSVLFQVLGQPGADRATQLEKGFYSPGSLYVYGNKLFACDIFNNRVLIWNTFPTTNQQTPDVVIGKPDFTTSFNSGPISGSTLSAPMGLYSDGTRLFVADYGNHRILVWNSIPTTNGQSADLALGQPNLNSNTSNNGGLSASSINGPYMVWGDGTRLMVADSGNNRVLIWSSIPTSSGQVANLVVGQPNFTTSSCAVNSSKLCTPRGLFSDGTKLYVADTGASRVVFILG